MKHPDYSPEALNAFRKNTLLETLGIVITKSEPGYLEGTMPVGPAVHQPMGILHGGASVVLAESLGSIGSFAALNDEDYIPVGMEINANHVRSMKEGILTGKAKLIHQGKKTHIWSIELLNEEGKLICISRLTVAIVSRSDKGKE
jgi:1,4-dihydroxy-2-naphthoyl-CoA hydrolase